jgi:phospholipase/lecithinase/hemolysin
MNDTIANVIDELASTVSDLQDLGVSKVLVNTMISYGCSPWLTRRSDVPYSSCNDGGNGYTDEHNTGLRDELGDEDDVMLLDVNSVVRDLVEPKQGSTLSGKQFKERLRPCCEADDEDAGDYCGLDGRYSICDHPEEYFFWDYEHPTQAGWRAVMQLLQGPIMAFLGISNLEHF